MHDGIDRAASSHVLTDHQQVQRFRCVGDDGSSLTVVERRHVKVVRTRTGLRLVPGARRLELGTGEPVRYLDADTFEVIETGELLRRE